MFEVCLSSKLETPKLLLWLRGEEQKLWFLRITLTLAVLLNTTAMPATIEIPHSIVDVREFLSSAGMTSCAG